MVWAEITPVTDNCYDHPDDELVRRCFSVFIAYFMHSLLDGHLVFSLGLSHPYPLQHISLSGLTRLETTFS